jgi:hypothetical protein
MSDHYLLQARASLQGAMARLRESGECWPVAARVFGALDARQRHRKEGKGQRRKKAKRQRREAG